jgi:hypothetical protein
MRTLIPSAVLPMAVSGLGAASTACYESSDNKIGSIDAVLIDKEGRVTSLIVGAGKFWGMGEKDVAIPFNAIRAREKDEYDQGCPEGARWFTYDKTTTTWTTAK